MCGVILGVIAFLFFGAFGVATVQVIPDDSVEAIIQAPPAEIVGPGAVSVTITNTVGGGVELMQYTVSGMNVDYNLLRQVPTNGERAVMEAELTGALIFEEGCFYVESETGDERYHIIWAPDYVISFERLYPAEVPRIFDANGALVARMDEVIYLSGGEIPATAQAEFEAENAAILPIPGCDGPYWLMGNEARAIGAIE